VSFMPRSRGGALWRFVLAGSPFLSQPLRSQATPLPARRGGA